MRNPHHDDNDNDNDNDNRIPKRYDEKISVMMTVTRNQQEGSQEQLHQEQEEQRQLVRSRQKQNGRAASVFWFYPVVIFFLYARASSGSGSTTVMATMATNGDARVMRRRRSMSPIFTTTRSIVTQNIGSMKTTPTMFAFVLPSNVYVYRPRRKSNGNEQQQQQQNQLFQVQPVVSRITSTHTTILNTVVKSTSKHMEEMKTKKAMTTTTTLFSQSKNDFSKDDLNNQNNNDNMNTIFPLQVDTIGMIMSASTTIYCIYNHVLFIEPPILSSLTSSYSSSSSWLSNISSFWNIFWLLAGIWNIAIAVVAFVQPEVLDTPSVGAWFQKMMKSNKL